MSYEIEKDWTTESGLRAVAILIDMGHRCGYVGVGPDHPLHGKGHSEHVEALKQALEDAKQGEIGKRGVIPLLCNDGETASMDIVFDVHGGVTYAGGGEKSEYPVNSDLWWIGFDCAHSGDGSLNPVMSSLGGPVRSLEYVADECESLAKQIASIQQAKGES